MYGVEGLNGDEGSSSGEGAEESKQLQKRWRKEKFCNHLEQKPARILRIPVTVLTELSVRLSPFS